MKVKANDIELYYEECGEGDPIIFVHGWMEDYLLFIMLWTLIHTLPYNAFAEGSDIKYYRPTKQIKEEAVKRALRTPKYAAYECFKEFCTNYDIQDRISNIKVPTLIIVGDKDSLTPVKMNQYLNRQIEGSKMVIIPDSKHMPMIEKADRVNTIMDEFINEIGR